MLGAMNSDVEGGKLCHLLLRWNHERNCCPQTLTMTTKSGVGVSGAGGQNFGAGFRELAGNPGLWSTPFGQQAEHVSEKPPVPLESSVVNLAAKLISYALDGKEEILS